MVGGHDAKAKVEDEGNDRFNSNRVDCLCYRSRTRCSRVLGRRLLERQRLRLRRNSEDRYEDITIYRMRMHRKHIKEQETRGMLACIMRVLNVIAVNNFVKSKTS